MARRLGAYQAKSGGLDAMEALSAKLSADLRSGVQALARLAAGDIPKTEQHKASGRTLWEGEEVALRYVLEDGKLNVCLRNLVEWRRYCKERRHEDHADEAASVREGLDAFEKGMGTVLRNAWNHTEALQTTDIPLLVQYISEVIKDAAAEPERVAEMSRAGDLKDRQEVGLGDPSLARLLVACPPMPRLAIVVTSKSARTRVTNTNASPSEWWMDCNPVSMV